MEWLTDSEVWTSLLTLTALEIILGIDNIIVISVLAHNLPLHQQQKARTVGISLALVTRLLFLLSIVWLLGLITPLFTLFSRDFSVKDIILIGGGLFLIFKGTHEIHIALDRTVGEVAVKAVTAMGAVIVQIVVLDIVFSIDSVITAIGMAQKVGVMIAAVVISLLIMLVASTSISSFIHKHPSLKMLALSFLLMVGVALIAEGAGFHVQKGYIYFAMAFSGLVEAMNIVAGNRRASGKGCVSSSDDS